MKTEDIQDWIEAYEFEELTKNQQLRVLAEMSEQEYMERRVMLLAVVANTALDLSTPTLEMQANLQQAFRASQPTSGSFWKQPIPFWQVAAGLLILLGASFSLQLFLQESPKERIVYRNQLKVEQDTIVEKIYIRDTIYKVIRIPPPKRVVAPLPEPPLDFAATNGDRSEQEDLVFEMEQLPNLDSNALKANYKTNKNRYDSSLYSLSAGQVL